MNPPASPIQKQGKKLYALPKEHLTLQVAMQNKGLNGPLAWASRALLMFWGTAWFICSESQLNTEQILLSS